jgi:phage portal protein BeeE
MRDFVKAYFQNAGVPAGILTTKAKLSEAQRSEIRERMRGQFGGPAGWHETMVLDNADATFTPLTSNLGQRGLVIPELDEISEARIPAVFGVPESLIGTRTSYQNGGYANKRAEEQHFWTGTLIPMYRELVGPLNLNLVPEFAGAEEIKFDLRDVGALQEDVTAVAHRARDMVDSGLWTVEEGRVATGMPAKLTPGETLLIPSNLTQVPAEDLGVTPEPVALPAPKPMEEAMT